MRVITDRLIDKIKETGNPTVAGLDTRIDFLPESMRARLDGGEDVENALVEFNCGILDEIGRASWRERVYAPV